MGKKSVDPDQFAEAEKCLLISTEKLEMLKRIERDFSISKKADSKGQVQVSFNNGELFFKLLRELTITQLCAKNCLKQKPLLTTI